MTMQPTLFCSEKLGSILGAVCRDVLDHRTHGRLYERGVRTKPRHSGVMLERMRMTGEKTFA
jgi:hypothetical protein